ncbi:PLP-dependent aminotransferase family protein [Kitasatospora purpeofusca]|uniref:MocR-like pyridoxine biosynthesis transcription factor PdxR n=1 Tax=Kitasatospora purpeofusca TaxID=67352 RepID=UPI0022591A0A|nr:PLP-dependent aminotransferase family protein [Kitasatospora purpeofusca]MCX4755915.1 PLP-dependent aminotransferase family protein [Kitasatospora purpeofusca]WSR36234.1 PLP-dependent aminotransferase family protein [Kitasatospora purpeofusca]
MHRSNDHPIDRSRTAGADFLQLDPGQAPAGGLADWLARRLREAIGDGRLPVGSRLPATRVLAADLRVSRGVVTDAYRRLGEEGRIAGLGRGGTVVVDQFAPGTVSPSSPLSPPLSLPPPPSTAAQPPPAQPPPARSTAARPGGTRPGPAHPRPAHSRTARGTSPAPASLFDGAPATTVFDSLRTASARIDLTPGVPDLAAFPRAAWLRAERAVLRDLAAPDFGYGDPRGTPALRRAVADWLARNRGIRADPEEVLVVAGAAQALALVGEVLRADGLDVVAVEDPGSLGTRQHLGHRITATPPVPVDAEGIRVDSLRAVGARAVLLTPAHQFPTGVVLGGARRRELLQWAAEGGLVIEDDYDAEHRYDRPPVPALRGVLPEQVLYLGSVSKLLAPALRTGWVLAPTRYRDALVDAKRLSDLGNAALPQLVLAHLMESGALERHLRLQRTRHRRRRDATTAAVAAHLPGASVHGAAAGLHLMLTFPDGLPCTDTELAAAALAHGVKVHPLSWHARLSHPPGLVLGYAAGTPGEIEEGIAVLGRLLQEAGPPLPG